jgi:N-acetylmuramoyl-L-alanine amidase
MHKWAGIVWFWAGFAVLAPLSAPAFAQARIGGISVEVTAEGGELVRLSGDGALAPKKAFALTNPSRIVIDLPRIEGKNIALPKDYSGNLIRAVRFGQFDATTSRIVLDVSRPARVGAVSPGNPASIEIIPTGEAPTAAPLVEDKPLVIIDAGHGGQDPGALGLHKTQEKQVTLNFARALRAALLRTGRYRVALTRDGDKFITLQDRVAIARKMKADIFVSLHADSNPRKEAKGLSIYTLSENASDAEAAALADRENKSDIIPGIDLNTTDADVASILIDLTQRETMNKSSALADAILETLHPKINKLPGTHRYAGFRVLKAPDIPSVLIELGFLSNATDERLVLSPEYRDLVVASIVKGIDRYRAGE